MASMYEFLDEELEQMCHDKTYTVREAALHLCVSEQVIGKRLKAMRKKDGIDYRMNKRPANSYNRTKKEDPFIIHDCMMTAA